ncbi:PLP-dependent aspartate aminotransferase family protein [uncultured Dysosmobacter sp.]|uniref:trans-sulfuration enzyme family protein n=1 Tax=uncultured Dysosmobacter sp. TaxID=2591384 RepID=UPI00260D1D5C|nr:aminotransferase class I/II-fold pyridoxal phosphate-dependent enzyme [uncultured Dysosmobacter sp.]
MEEFKNMDFATRQIHVGKEPDQYGALVPPIYMTSTFEAVTSQYFYSRISNPSLTLVEKKIASLEHGEAALATASGIGAISSALWTALNAGDEIIASETIYGCTFSLLKENMPRFGVKVLFVDMADIENISRNLTPRTKVVYFETPCNPTLKVLDIAAIAKVVHDYNPDIKVFVDNTFCSPYIQTPLTLGADVVVHSATKYINGHGDLLAGFVVGSSEFIEKCRVIGVKDMTGSVMSPMNAFLVARGLKTLDVRMEKHCSNAEKLVEFLRQHPAVEKVYYPGLEDFPGHEIAKKQMSRFGGMLAIDLKGSREQIGEALQKFEVCTLAVSLGDAETLVEHPATMTHSTYSAEDLKAAGISEGMVRISVGLEGIDDLIEDFRRVLDTLV